MNRSSRLFRRLRAVVILAAAGGAACDAGSGIGPGEVPTALQALAGDGQEGRPGWPLADSLAVQVLDGGGEGMAGVEIRFEVVEGGGRISPQRATTDASGVARAAWVLGSSEGAQRVAARVAADAVAPLTLSATARYGPEARIEQVSGDAQVMPAGCPLPDPLVVRVRDAADAPVAGAPVLFGPDGADPLGAVRATTNAEGIAAVPWPAAGEGEHRVVAAIAAAEPERVVFRASGVPTSPGGYASIGNRIVSASTCRTHRFVGVARPGLQWWPDDARLSNPETAAAEFALIRAWGANVVRLPVYQRYWLYDLRSNGITYSRQAYRDLIAATVERANAAGLDVIIDLHASDRGDPNFPDTVTTIQQMADVNHSIPFWREVATRFRDNGRVLFQLYNEPNQISWELWRNGGIVPAGDTHPPQSSGVEFQAAGMQALYEAVRGAGASNLVIVNGMHWGYDLSRLDEFALDGYNIVYATHPYDYPDKQPAAWDRDFGAAARTYPVMITEFGDYLCNRNGYYEAVLDYADRLGLSWVAWAWWAPPPDRPELVCGFPALITDWSGTPSPTGQVVKARLERY